MTPPHVTSTAFVMHCHSLHHRTGVDRDVKRELGEVNALLKTSEERARVADELADKLSKQVAHLEGTLQAQAASHAQELLLMQEEWSQTEALMRQWEQALEARERELESKAEVCPSQAVSARCHLWRSDHPCVTCKTACTTKQVRSSYLSRVYTSPHLTNRFGTRQAMKQMGQTQPVTQADRAAAMAENEQLQERVAALDAQLEETKARAAERAEVARNLQASNAELQSTPILAATRYVQSSVRIVVGSSTAP
jgi:hypothetical protein